VCARGFEGLQAGRMIRSAKKTAFFIFVVSPRQNGESGYLKTRHGEKDCPAGGRTLFWRAGQFTIF